MARVSENTFIREFNNLPKWLETKVNGIEIRWKFEDMDQTWFAEFLRYGALRWANDKATGLSGMAKYDFIRAIADQVNGGEVYAPTRSAPAASKFSEAEQLAIKTAKTILLEKFKKATGLAKIADMIGKSKNVAAFFTDTGVWKDDSVMLWIKQQKDRAGVDYVADAEKQLAAAESALAEGGDPEDDFILDVAEETATE